MNKKLKKKREGLCFISKYGESYVIMEYKDSCNVKIKFQNGYEKYYEWSKIKKNQVLNPYTKTVFNIGYIGEGKYNKKKYNKIYDKWHDMLKRLYDPYSLNRRPTYIDCYICDEWLCFQNFAKWYEENYYEIPGEVMQLDKDILYKGNKIYSPETCVFVPQRINNLFTKRQNDRGKYPIGVTEYRDKNGKIYLRADCQVLKGQEHLKSFPANRPFEAFTCYKQFKEGYIKRVADKYKELIPENLYNALYKYEIEIND